MIMARCAMMSERRGFADLVVCLSERTQTRKSRLYNSCMCDDAYLYTLLRMHNHAGNLLVADGMKLVVIDKTARTPAAKESRSSILICDAYLFSPPPIHVHT